jgi:sugar lactone lactonase YvrE
MLQAELVFRAEALIGEGALWDSQSATLLWIDIPAGEIHRFNPSDNSNRLVASLGQYIGTVVQRRGGGLLTAAQRGFFFVEEQTGAITPILDPEAHLPRTRFNDGKCDPSGRLWAGTMDIDCITRYAGSLYRLDDELRCERMLSNVSISNGIVWSPDKATMYFADTPTGVVDAFDYDDRTGSISNRRTVVRIADGGPDGMTIDRDGNLWVAQWGGWQVGCYDPFTGRKLEEVRVPASQVASCAFGGKEMDELYITTARNGIVGEELQKQPLAGSLFRVKPGVRGLEAYHFAG